MIAKLDQLARNVAFVSNLMEGKVEFVACDNSFATKLTIHILAAVVEHEQEMISARTTAALVAAKARGVRLGNPALRSGSAAAARVANAARVAQADRHAADVLPFIRAARSAGAVSLAALTRALTARGIRTPAGNLDWSDVQVRRILARQTFRSTTPNASKTAGEGICATDTRASALPGQNRASAGGVCGGRHSFRRSPRQAARCDGSWPAKRYRGRRQAPADTGRRRFRGRFRARGGCRVGA